MEKEERGRLVMRIRRLTKTFNENLEEKKKDFGWGKALGTTAAIAGTMYGAKKGVFGNTVRRGYNTAYGKLGNAIGNKSMVQSAASDWAKGSVNGPGFFGRFNKNKMSQYNNELTSKRNEFMNKNWTSSQFKNNTNTNINSGNTSNIKSTNSIDTTTTTTQTTTQPQQKTKGKNKNTNQDQVKKETTTTPQPQLQVQDSPKIITPSVLSKDNARYTGPMTGGFAFSPVNRGNAEFAFQRGTVSYGRKSPRSEAELRRQRRISTGSSAKNYQAAKDMGLKTEKTVKKPKISREEYLMKKAKKTQEYNQNREMRLRKPSLKNAELMGISNPDPNTFYTNQFMFQ